MHTHMKYIYIFPRGPVNQVQTLREPYLVICKSSSEFPGESLNKSFSYCSCWYDQLPCSRGRMYFVPCLQDAVHCDEKAGR